MNWRLPWPARIALSALLLALVFSFVPWRGVLTAFRGVSPLLWSGAVAAFLVGHVVAALKWRLLLGVSVRVSIREALRAHFAGLAANLFLPGLVGGDFVRAGWLGRSLGSWASVGVAGVVDRLLDTVALLALALFGALWTARLSGIVGSLLIAGAVLVVAGVTVVALTPTFLSGARPDSGAAHIATAIRDLRSRPGRSAGALALSTAVQAAFIVVTVQLGRGAGLLSFTAAWFVSWPLAKIAAIVPLTFAGVGTREGALVVLMNLFGAPPERTAAAALLWTSVLLTGAVLGGLAAWMAGAQRS